jgi:hypothetical protein
MEDVFLEESQARAPSDGAPMIYDVSTDEERPVTQDDVDRLMLVGSTQALLRRAIIHLEGMAAAVIKGEKPREDFHSTMRNLGVM